ncbi:HlyD family type I secretion periplasmic adaptor subunit [Thiosulfatimonas sediminis]|uniref:Membrane fusion protein (MFP) family protein n=1 Tax=Thiosulfatimonas sediminis TaxID=2675054 RepID=A0A6F8PS02_9GAMM|nr:HlyD family type I secretion periplasmic adaptor subunit [Thiosulfatimonas sediminis]BBP44889.1 HlyD family type I secretion periplasmic adaptor subunit [Thiosulfatimonas sediminis]
MKLANIKTASQQQLATESTDKDKIQSKDIEFMSSLSQASLEKPTFRSQLVVWIILLVVIWLLAWANYAELDKIIRGDGKVVPSTQIQVIQNLEGGIVEQLFVKSGDKVEKGQTLLKLDNTQFASSFGESQIRESQLIARAQRLAAEANDKKLNPPTTFTDPKIQDLFNREYELYQTRQKQFTSNDTIIVEQIEQKKMELNGTYQQQTQLKRSLDLITQEVNLMRPLVAKGVASEVDLLRLQRDQNEVLSKLKDVQSTIPQLRSVITEYRAKRVEAKEDFMNQSQQELNDVLSEKAQLEQSKVALEDRVQRTDVKSPVHGTIKQVFVNTIGGVVQPGSNMVEIVPDDDTLVLETRIKPADIGFLYPGLAAKVKFTAYDFAIYGGLDAKVISISADTINDEEGNSYYLAKIETVRNHLGTEKDPLYLLPGMTANVDIIVGKHTVLDYILKPIIKAKDLALRES